MHNTEIWALILAILLWYAAIPTLIVYSKLIVCRPYYDPLGYGIFVRPLGGHSGVDGDSQDYFG